LARRVTANSYVFIYYSGHGAPDIKTKSPYLIPYDIRRGIKGSGLVFCYFHAVKPSLEEIFKRKEADEGIYEAFTRKEAIKHNFYFSA